jgi:enoyl-CoA hydratase/carnithine racemase
MSPQFETLIYHTKDLVARITINRPEARNALNLKLMKELCLALEEAEQDSGVGVVVLTGSGDRFFCPGLDLNWAKGLIQHTQQVWNMVSQYARIIYDLRNIGKPVIARVNGSAAGGGCEMIIHCDLAIAAEHARLMQGEGGIGAIATYATQSLTPIIGDRRARWFLFTDEVITAETAREWGLVNKVVPYDRLDEEVDKLCNNLLEKAPWSLRFTKTQANIWFDLVAHTFYEGRDFWSLQSAMPEPLEGITAFMEKRPPRHMERRKEAAAGKSVEYLWGPPIQICPACQTRNLPADFDFCGKCGTKLT